MTRRALLSVAGLELFEPFDVRSKGCNNSKALYVPGKTAGFPLGGSY